MRYRFLLCDVFTDTRFGGNPLAVLPEAQGLDDAQMQAIAREFNFSESTFVFPAEQGQSRKVRIFTPTTEVPFAGHPNIGTAFALASTGAFGPVNAPTSVVFEEKAGLVPISIEPRAGAGLWCELSAPEAFSMGQSVEAELLVAAMSLEPRDIITGTHPPLEASVGLPFVFAELRDRDALGRARVSMDGFEAIAKTGAQPHVFLYVRSSDDFDLRARMFAPTDGVPEDPATGSANCALAGLLAHYSEERTASFQWRVAQGVEMGRPSVLEARSEKAEGSVVSTWVGGSSVLVGEGCIETGA
jgi:trans-2,3-dihydro-3-hydroxyanthranilate isomerase